MLVGDFTRHSFAWLAISIAATTTATPPAWAEPMRLSAAEADQITAGSFGESWLDDAWWDDLLDALKGGDVKTMQEGDTIVIELQEGDTAVIELNDSQSMPVVNQGRVIDFDEVRDRAFGVNSIAIVMR
jgi:hypothetical protein